MNGKKRVREFFYVQDFWGLRADGSEIWANRSDALDTKAAALERARDLSKGSGGGRVRVLHSITTVVTEVKS